MKDVFGTEIVVGSKVAFAKGGKHALYSGVVIKINPKTVTVERKEEYEKWCGYSGKYLKTGVFHSLTYNRHPGDVAVVNQ